MVIFASGKNGDVWQLESYKRGLVIRYWGCNLKCPLCFAQSYAYRGSSRSRVPRKISIEEALNQARAKITAGTLWCRIEGGEPLQSEQHMLMTVKLAVGVLKLMEKGSRAVIQTNGLWLANENNAAKFCEALKNEMKDLESGKRIAVEISFKGPNSNAVKVYSGRSDIDVFDLQRKAFINLIGNVRVKMWNEGNYNVAVYPVAGFGPDLEGFVFIPLDPEERALPLFHPSTWSPSYKRWVYDFFGEISQEYKEVYGSYVSEHGKRMALYGLEPANWQKAWTSRVKRDEKVREFVLNYIRVNSSQSAFNMFREDLSGVLNQIIAPLELIEKAREMCDVYAWPEPLKHYPYL